MKIKALLFDFDGVILDSLNVKTQAFYDMYLPFGKEVAEKAASHHLAHGGISRFEKFKIYHQEFLGITIDSDRVNELSNEFSNRVLQGVIDSPEVKGIRSFLEQYHNTYKMWIITGTPTEEIKVICNELSFTNYFVDIYGSPQKKDFWTNKIIDENGFSPKEIVFIGDATTDYDAAMKCNTHFILREHEDNIDFFADKEVLRIKNFIDFDTVINSI